jgi:hypothetical protein
VEGSGCHLGGLASSPDPERWRLGVRHHEGGLPPAVLFIDFRSYPKGLVTTAALQRHCARGFFCSTGMGSTAKLGC